MIIINNKMSDYSIYCEDINCNIDFDSFITDENVEMFNLTTIANQFDYTNKNIVDWFNLNISNLHVIDNIIIEDEHCDDDELISISDNTIIKIEGEWYVNFNVLIEYLRDVDYAFMNEVIYQVMFDKAVMELEEEENEEEEEETEEDEEESEDQSE